MIFTHDDTIFAYFDAVADSGCFDNASGSDMDEISYFHGIVVEIASISLVRWPSYDSQI